MWWFIVGLVLGFLAGVFAVACCQVAKEREGNRWSNQRRPRP